MVRRRSSNRLLLEAGLWHHQETWGMDISPFDVVDPLAIGITDNNPQSTSRPATCS